MEIAKFSPSNLLAGRTIIKGKEARWSCLKKKMMVKKRWILLGASMLIIGFLVLPKRATSDVSEIIIILQSGRDITQQIEQEAMKQLSDALSHVMCFRWRNPVDLYPIRQDTIIIECMSEKGYHRFVFVGSQNRFVIDSHNVFYGKKLFNEIINII